MPDHSLSADPLAFPGCANCRIRRIDRWLRNHLVGRFRPSLNFSSPCEMHPTLKQKIMAVCDNRINEKGADVGLSFYAFFHNRNDGPERLTQAATWWIQTHKLDHFEKATKIKRLVEQELSQAQQMDLS